MKSLVIGGSKGFGKSLVESLEEQGHEVTTVGRSDGDFQVDIGVVNEWEEVLEKLKKETFQTVAFVVGYARAVDPDHITQKDFDEHRQRSCH